MMKIFKNLNGFRILLILSILLLGVGNVWADFSTYYYAKVTASANPTGAGSVYVNTSNSQGGSNSATSDGTTTQNEEKTFYLYATASYGYQWSTWTKTGSNSGTLLNATTRQGATYKGKASSSSSSSPTEYTVRGDFTRRAIEAVGTPTVTSLTSAQTWRSHSGSAKVEFQDKYVLNQSDIKITYPSDIATVTKTLTWTKGTTNDNSDGAAVTNGLMVVSLGYDFSNPTNLVHNPSATMTVREQSSLSSPSSSIDKTSSAVTIGLDLTPVFSTDKTSYTFPATEVNTSAQTTISATSYGDLPIGNAKCAWSYTLSGTNADQFGCSVSGGVATLTYHPSAAASHTASLTMTAKWTDANGTVLSYTAPPITISGSATAPDFSIGDLNYATTTDIGTAVKTLTLQDVSYVTLANIDFSGDNASCFSATSYNTTTKSFDITFTAPVSGGRHQAGTYTSTATVTGNAAASNAVRTATLTAVVSPAALASFNVPNAITFNNGEDMESGTTDDQTITLTNMQNVVGTPTITIDGTDASMYAVQGGYDSENHAFTIRFTASGTKGGKLTADATVTVENYDGETLSKTVELNAFMEEVVNSDVRVTNATGGLVDECDWAKAIKDYQATGYTFTLLRNINLGTITATNNITKAITIDLNGKELRAAVNATSVGILNVNAVVELTIKDSRGGGKIINEIARNAEIRTITVTKGTLTLESGTISCHNTAQYSYGTAAIGGAATNAVAMETHTVQMAAGSVVNIRGGRVEAYGTRTVQAIRQLNDKNNTTTLNITGGEVYAEGPAYVYGIHSVGNVNISGGTVTTYVNDHTTNGNAFYIDSLYRTNKLDNTYILHRYNYGIYLTASSNATAANCYAATLNVTGGTINVTNVNKTLSANGTTLYTEHTYGIYAEISATGAGAGKTAPDGTKVQKACAVVDTFENATLNVTHAGVQAYGILVRGCYNSKTNTTTPLKIKNSTINVTSYQTAYGVFADAYVNWSSTLTNLTGNGGCTYGNVEMTNVTINATTTGGTGAYCAWASATSGTVAKAKAETGSTSTGNATYYGEYAVAGKITVNSGTYTANAATSSAYAIGSTDRAKCVRNVNGVFANRDAAADPQGALSDYALTADAEAYPELYIHGGTFRATTETAGTARAVKSGGTTIIDGGEFEANAGTSSAVTIAVHSGKTVVSGVTLKAEANTDANAVYVPATVSEYSLFGYAGEVELNNCTAIVNTRTGANARGVYVNRTFRTYTQKNFDDAKAANNSNYKNYGDYWQIGTTAICGKATINGGSYTVTADTLNAYGVIVPNDNAVSTDGSKKSIGYLDIRNATFNVSNRRGAYAYGIHAGTKAYIDGCTINATAKTSNAYGVAGYDEDQIVKNCSITVNATTTSAYGIMAYGVVMNNGVKRESVITVDDCIVNSTAGTKTAYAVYATGTSGGAYSTAYYTGSMAVAGTLTVNSGKYTASAGTSGAYAAATYGKIIKNEAFAVPQVIINGGKFKGKEADVYANSGAQTYPGEISLTGGVYVLNNNLSTYVVDGYEDFPLPSDRPEYNETEKYRYCIEPEGMHGIDVCKIGNTKFKSLEEALQVVTSGQTIVMIANYTLSAGDYILPSGANLLVPRTSSQTSLETTFSNIVKYNEYSTPSAYLTLTFAPGARLDVGANSVVQVASLVSAKGQMNGTNGAPYGPHGKIVLQENSQIILEDKAKLYAWGYITGAGMIDAKKGSTVYECMQIRDWRGGTNTRNIYSSVFPFNQYFIQNVESKIRFRPGSEEYGHGAVNASSSKYPVSTKLIGTSDALFLMNSADVSADTWVQKSYDYTRDYQVYEVNSAAQLSNLVVSGLPLIGSISTADYTLPLVNNMHIHLLSGKLEVIQDVLLQPGVIIEIDKEAKCVMKSGKKMYVQDSEDTQGYDNSLSFNTIPYSPQGSVAGKRTLQDASINMHGAFEFNGYLYTSEHGANIFSTNEDAGTILFKNSSPSNATLKICNTGGTIVSKTFTTPQLKNGEGETPEFTSTSGSVANDEYAYYLSQWRKWVASDCFTIDKTDNSNWKYYIKPAEYVQVTSNQPDANKLHHDAATGTRNFVWDENCYWWEVVTTPTAEGYYRSINADHNGKYNYYYYDSSAGCWKIKKITVTWNINGSNTNYSVGYGTKPEWLGATPTKSSSSTNYVWRWDGWTRGSSTEVLANTDLPIVTENTTFTAHFYEKYYEYNIIFKNSDGTILDARNWKKGDMPSYDGTPTKNPSAEETYEFDGTWTPSIHTVDGAQVYVANYATAPRAYTITFLNYDMSELGTTQVVYNGTPSNATYLAAVAPVVEDPYKPDNSAFSFEFVGWRLQGASSNGFAQVKGDQTYIAQYNQTNKKYRIEFVDEDETLLHYLQLEYGETPSYSWANPANKQDAEWNYTFSGWTPEFTEVQGAQTYTAVYNKTKREYTITWLNDDNSQIDQTSVAYGVVPTHVAATKEPDAQYTYTFAGWSPEPAAVTGDATYTAQFNSTVNKYDITWVDGNGVTLKTEKVEYGQTPAYSGATPTKTATEQYSYTFNNTWSPAITSVTGDATYTAQFGSTVNEYTITWVDGNGETLKTEQVAYGQTPAYTGATPTKTATAQYTYTFSGWDPAIVPVAGDATYTAQFSSTVNQYTLTVESNNAEWGTVTGGGTYDYGTEVTITATPATGYSFSSWTLPTGITAANGYTANSNPIRVHATAAEKTITANFVAKTYTVTLDNQSATTAGQASVTATYDEAMPSIAANLPARTGHEFGGYYSAPNGGGTQYYDANGTSAHIWDIDAASPTLYAKWTPQTYNITYKDKGNVAFSGVHGSGYPTKHTYGTATELVDPSREGYIFEGWFTSQDCSTGQVATLVATAYTADITLYAKWRQNKVTVTWDATTNGGTAAAPPTTKVTPGEAVGTLATTSKTGHSYKWYTAPTGGTEVTATTKVSEDKTFYAQFTANTNKLAWNFNGGTPSGDYTEANNALAYGSAINYPTLSKTGYTFAGWSTNATSMPDADLTITASWTPITYNITYTLNGGSATNPETYNIETTTFSLTNPTKTGYDFVGWTGSNGDTPQKTVTIAQGSTGDKTYTANWIQNYTITWKDGQEVITQEEWAKGSTPSFDYQKPQTVQYTYELTGWSDESQTKYMFPNPLPEVTGNATYTAQYNSIVRSYTIRFVNDDNSTVLKSSPVQYGVKPEPPANDPTSTSTDSRIIKTFIGWEPSIVDVAGDATYTAKYQSEIVATEDDPITIEENQTVEVISTTVETTGKLQVEHNATLTTNCLILQATAGAGDADASGEIIGAENISMSINAENTSVYFDLTLNTWARHWHAFGVPWQIDDLRTIKLIEIKDKQGNECHNVLTLGRDYEIIYYNGDTRANQGPGYHCWDYVADGDGILTPGKAYMIGFIKPTGTVRFTKAAGAAITTGSTELEIPYYTGNGKGTDAGWNAIANPKTYHATMDAGVTFCHVHNADTMRSDGFTTVEMSAIKFVVGKAVYVQAVPEQSVVEIGLATSTSSVAPRRSEARDNAPQYYAVHIMANDQSADRIYIKADADKEEDVYTNSIDVAKMGVSTVRAQMWIDRYNTKLAVNTMAPVKNIAVYPLGISLPETGEYEISVQNSATGDQSSDIIYLTYDGRVIWNLSYAPYTVSLEKGTNTHYGLKLVHSNNAPAVTTDIEQSATGNDAQQIMKVLMDEKVYILRGGEIYTITGQKAQ